jgi:hypothetical protein
VIPSLFEVPSTPPGSDAVAVPGIAGSPGLDAVNAIIAIVRAHPGEITLVALGRQLPKLACLADHVLPSVSWRLCLSAYVVAGCPDFTFGTLRCAMDHLILSITVLIHSN